VAVAGGTLAGIGNLVDDAFGVSASGLLSAPGGFGLVMGLLTAGGSALATPPPWDWMGLGLVLVAIGIAIGEHAGSALVDLSWIALAFLLGRPHETLSRA
jgi:hypothetical protein